MVKTPTFPIVYWHGAPHEVHGYRLTVAGKTVPAGTEGIEFLVLRGTRRRFVTVHISQTSVDSRDVAAQRAMDTAMRAALPKRHHHKPDQHPPLFQPRRWHDV